MVPSSASTRIVRSSVTWSYRRYRSRTLNDASALTRPSAVSWYGYCSDIRSSVADAASNAAGGS
jgi:hypothetical protein